MSGALTPEDRQRLDTLFERAAELPPAEHAAFVARECSSNAALRDELAGLLQGLAGEDRLSRIQPWTSLRVGTEIGRYKLLERVGEGGMGEVYAAEQREPVVRRVALKVIKAGMDSAQVVARFHAERQALARMSHPNIAQVFDAGTTADGRPYFVMEFVAGEPITGYCDRRKLALRERLELFLSVCEGVQHAHQKGIIHRDLKPSNLLVLQQDGRALPKIIDFGVARATSGQLTELTLHTMLGQIVGTLDYMSPEQADPTSVDIDTRSDIYSLGVVLYQLASGLLPFERESRVGTPFSELVRTIRDTEPPKPSARLKRQTGTSSAIAALHGTDERTLVRQLSGDLDWICLQALEKDPARRYSSASALADDVRRHLAHEPVLAGKPGALYRARKYVRRHRLGVTAALLVAAATSAGAIGTISGWVEAAVEREKLAEAGTRARAEAVRSQRMKDSRSLADLVVEAEELWPAVPEKLGELEAWLARARGLVKGLPAYRDALAELRSRAQPRTDADIQRDRRSHPKAPELAQKKADFDSALARYEKTQVGEEQVVRLEKDVSALESEISVQRSWRFDLSDDQAQHDLLDRLVPDLEGLESELLAPPDAPLNVVRGAPPKPHGWSIPKRIEFAERLRVGFSEGGEYARAWADALPGIHAAYPEMQPPLTRQMGLVPLGPDRESGLWEFAHLQSGEPAIRAADGTLTLTPASGIVLVLLRGAKVFLGAQNTDQHGRNFDPQAINDPWENFEGPVREVLVSAFFQSKYEMTQAQWARSTGSNPSISMQDQWPVVHEDLGIDLDILDPVNMVSFNECDRTLGRLGLELPTSPQWEYAARAGTTTPWWTGAEETSLGPDTQADRKAAENVLDQSWLPDPQTNFHGHPTYVGKVRAHPAPWNDGSLGPTPVGTYRANGFGLFDVLGNVAEWTSTSIPVARNSDNFAARDSGHVIRGGGYRYDAQDARCAVLTWTPGANAHPVLGLRPAREIDP